MMKTFRFAAAALTLAAIAGLATPARAAFSVDINSTVTPSATQTVGDSTVTLTPVAETADVQTLGGSFLDFGAISTTSGAATNAPDTFNFNYTFHVTLTETGTSNTGSFDVSGNIAGGLNGGTVPASTINNTYFSPTVGSTFIVNLGSTPVSVTLQPFTPPGAPPVSGQRVFTVFVKAVPEPASMALVALGGLGTVLAFRRKRSA